MLPVTWTLLYPPSPILEQSPPEEKQCGGGECSLRAQGTIMGECVTLQSHAHSLTQHSQTNTSISRQALAPLTFPNQSITPSEVLRARLMSFTDPNPVRYSNPDQLDSEEMLNLSRPCPFGELKPGNYSLNVFEEINPDQVNTNHSPLSDEEETDVLLPEKSFSMHRSVSLCLENSQIHHRNIFMVPQSPDLTLKLRKDVPMSPELVQRTEPHLDVVMSPPLTSRPNNGLDINQQLNCTDVPMSPTQPPAPPPSSGT